MTTTHFDKAAADWDKKERRVKLAAAISGAIGKLPLSTGMDGLEYGCGTGLVGLALASRLGRLTAMDTSQGMLDVLRQKTSEQGLTNVSPLRCDLLADSYSHQHDLIFCSMTLHHIKASDGLLQRFCELLKPGGYLAVADLVQEDGSFHDPTASGVMHHGFDPEQLESLLTGQGMVEVRSRTIHTIVKPERVDREYPIFLLTGRKP